MAACGFYQVLIKELVNTVASIIQNGRHMSRLEHWVRIGYSEGRRRTSNSARLSEHAESVLSVWVPHMLKKDQTEMRVRIRMEWKERIAAEPDILNRGIAVDETWIHYFDPLTNQESCTWKSSTSPRKKKMRRQQKLRKK